MKSGAGSDGEGRLARRLGLADCVVIGLGSMIGAGVFAAVGPAAAAAGAGLVLGLLAAGGVAYCNATSSAQLAAIHPESGGTYVYAREQLGPMWGYLAGWSFVVGKVASCAAMALTFGTYVAPEAARALGVGAVITLTAVNYRGVEKTARLTRFIVAVVLAALTMTVAGTLGGGTASVGNFEGWTAGGVRGILEAGGMLFFAFAGYARIATLGEEVRDPQRTIPLAIPLALGITLVVYLAVATSALAAVGPRVLAASEAPLAAAVGAGSFETFTGVVRVGAAVASLGVLLSLLAGVSRTVFAMAANRELPATLAAVHRRSRVPHRAEVAVGILVVVLVSTFDLRSAIGFSSFLVLGYYAITNASAWMLPAASRRWPRGFSVAGFVGCVVLALNLPVGSVLGGLAVFGLGALARPVLR